MTSLKILSLASFIFSYSLNISAAETETVTASIKPTGNVESVEQIQVRFSRPMFKIGQVDQGVAPIESDCLKNGSGYWIDEKNWVYTFNEAPEANKTCKITTAKDLKALDGKAVKETAVEFKTLNTQIIRAEPRPHSTIDPNQAFVLTLNGTPDPKWIKEHVYFVVAGYGDQVKPVILDEKEKRKLLSEIRKNKVSRYAEYDESYEDYLDANRGKQDLKDENIVVIKPDRTLPRGFEIAIHWLQDYNYRVQEAFKVQMSCERETAGSPCIPLGNITLNFNDFVNGSQVEKVYLRTAKGEKIEPTEKATLNPKTTFEYLTFKGPFMPQTTYQLVIEKSFRSSNGEPLSNIDAFPLNVGTDDLPSLLKVDRSFAVIESSNAVLPVTLRNIEDPVPTKNWVSGYPLNKATTVLNSSNVAKVIELLRTVDQSQHDKPITPASDFKAVDLKVTKKLSAGSTEIIGIPLAGKGLHFTEFKSRILGQKLNYEPGVNADYYLRTLSLVTDIGLTAKYTKSEVIVWATSLDKGTPIVNAPAFLYTVGGEKVAGARTDENGLAHFKLTPEQSAKLQNSIPNYYGRYYNGFFVFVQKDDDFSFVFSRDTQGIESYRFGINLPSSDPDIIYHAILEKNLLRPGETLKAKLIYRKLEPVGLSIPQITLPPKIQIKSLLSKTKYLAKVKWDLKNGTGTFSWKIPDEATLGNYRITSPDGKSEDEQGYEAEYEGEEYAAPSEMRFGKFSVEEFKVPNISAQLTALGTPWVNAKNHKIEFNARYFSGGPAAKLPVKVRYSVSPSSFSPSNEDYQDFNWQAGDVKEGLTKYSGEMSQERKQFENEVDTKLDDFGITQVDLGGITYKNEPQNLTVSAEYTDANGDIQSLSRAYPIYRSPLVIGLRSTTWYQTADSFEFEAAVLDIKSKPIRGKTVTISLYKVENYSTRKKILGGFYSYENYTDIKRVKQLCSETTDDLGKVKCKGSDKSLSGEYFVLAEAADDSGQKITTKTSTFLSGDRYWYGGSDSDRMDLIPNKKSFEPGENAEFQVRGPITAGQLLVTVERNGVLQKFVQNFDSKNPTFKVKIAPEWAPNVVISAVLIRGRVEGKVTGLLDLGKPSLKMGMSSIRVGIKKHLLNVKVKTDKEVYSPRESVNAEIEITDHEGKHVNGEIALAVVDEGLLALKDNSSWKLLETMMPLRAHTVDTAYLISHVLGKRTLGLKAVPTGGDGAGQAARELFDTSLFWNPKVTVTNGKAKVSFKTNDSLTAFKVVAIAQAEADKFGTGDTSMKVSKDIQSFSSLALAVRTGDKYSARFSIRNSGKNAVSLSANLKLNDQMLEQKIVSLDVNKSVELSWPVEAKDGVVEQKFELKISQGGKVVDLLKFKQPIQPVWPMRSFGSSFRQDLDLKVPITQAKDSTRSEVVISAVPTLASENPGVKQFWDNYPYDCFEQRLSKAISLNKKDLFDSLMKISEAYIDRDGLIKFYPMERWGSIFLTNYVLQISKRKGWDLKPELEEKALEALRRFFDGRLSLQWYYTLEKKYLELIKLETLDSLVLYDKAKASEYSTLELQLEMLPNNYLAHALSVLATAPDTAKEHALYKQSLEILRSRTVASSKGLSLKDAVSERMYGMFVYDDVSFAKLLQQAIRTPEFRDDVGKLILSFIAQQKAGAWYNTMANSWAVVTMEKYKDEFEKDPVIGEIKWGINKDSKSIKMNNDPHRETFKFSGDDEAFATFKGSGKPWWTVLVNANPPATQDLNHGISIEKTWKALQVKDSSKKSVGDVWEVTLKIKTKSEFQWLAVRDPIPPGGSIINEQGSNFSEKKAVEYRVYEPWFAANERTYVYQIRLNQPGVFNLPTTRAEAMYDTDIYGEKLNEKITIVE